MRSRKVAVAMSGGVDSGVAAALVVKAGYQAAGFHMHLWAEKTRPESLEAAKKTAQQLGIPFYVVDLEKIFKKRVVAYFLKEYGLGRTPNPCVRCNRLIKFGELLHHAKKLGYGHLATGHYARVKCDTVHVTRKRKNVSRANVLPVTYHLLHALDRQKDQSYFLYSLIQKQLSQVMFPVGDYLKKEVMAMAKKWQLPVAERPESQEICFFPESDYRPFLKRQIPKRIKKGVVVDSKGKIIGEHYGLPLYTIGQRHGFRIESGVKSQVSGIIPPYYVIAKNAKKNQLIVGFGKEAERKEFWVKEVNWIIPDNVLHANVLRCSVRIRHQGELMDCMVTRHAPHVTRKRKNVLRANLLLVTLSEGERGIAPGQAAVFYKGEEVLGGGIIIIKEDAIAGS